MKNEVVVLRLKWITEEITEIVHMVTVRDEPPILVWKNNYDELQMTVINMFHNLRLHLPMGEEKRGNLELTVETEDKRHSEIVVSAGNVPSSDLIHQNGSYFSVLSTMMEGVWVCSATASRTLRKRLSRTPPESTRNCITFGKSLASSARK